MIIDSSVIEGLRNNTVTVIRCEKCGEIYATPIEVTGFYDDEHDVQYATLYKGSCPECGHCRKDGVAMNPPSVEI